MPEVGDKAPDFSLVNQKGETVSLKSLLSIWGSKNLSILGNFQHLW